MFDEAISERKPFSCLRPELVVIMNQPELIHGVDGEKRTVSRYMVDPNHPVNIFAAAASLYHDFCGLRQGRLKESLLFGRIA